MSDIVRLNVGGKKFSTSRHTLLWHGDSFFTGLLSGRLPSSQDETGAIFIDRDPQLFSIILNYLRSGELNSNGIDLGTLRSEAQFYGLDSLVKKLSLCEENFRSGCGDLLFHAYMPPPDFSQFCLQNESSPVQAEPNVPSTSGSSFETVRPTSPNTDVRDTSATDGVTLRNAKPVAHASGGNADDASDHHVSRPVTLITCYQNIMVVVYKDHIGVFHLRDTVGWRLVWMSPRMNAPIDRVAVTAKSTNAVFNPTSSAFSPIPGPFSVTGPGYGSNSMTNMQQPIPGQPTSQVTPICLVACAIGPKIIVWCLYPPLSSCTSAVALCGSTLGVATTPSSSGLSPLFSTTGRFGQISLPKLKEPWPHKLIGRYDLNGRAVDYLVFIGAHLVALSRRGLVGVRHVMTNTWQVWSTVPILSYCVAASELLLLGYANGRICSINIQKFPLRIVDNDLLVTEMYRDPLQDPITALSMRFIKSTTDRLGCIEIAYGTLSGRVGLIVQYPENVGYSPQLLQTFSVHRSMVTRVELSDKHLISVCSESNHVRTWAITRFRGIISTHPGCIPTASFHVTTLDTTSSQAVVDSVCELAQSCVNKTGSAVRDVVRSHSNVTTPQFLRGHAQPLTSMQRPDQPQPQQQTTQCSQRSSQAFRFSNWRRHGSHSRSPVTALGSADSRDSPAQIRASNTYAESAVSPSENPVEPSMLPGSQSADTTTSYQTLSTAPASGADLFVMPRTSWLHEDLGHGVSRDTALSGDASLDLAHSRSTSLVTTFSELQVGRCTTFNGPPSSSRVLTTTSGRASRDTAATPDTSKSLIDIHRFANDPGPYGEREDVLVFIQKVTPFANKLYVRLASTGKRVCVIHAVDNTPISSFWVHEHDGSNRIGAHPRRYLFTGHTDGSIQVWDLTTALAALKSYGGIDASNPLAVTFPAVPDYSTPAAATVLPTAGATTNCNSSLIPGNGATFASNGGPNSHELLSLLQSCQLGASSSLLGLTPSDSLNSVVLSVPTTSSS